jgi:hypothetical protein
LRSQKDSVKSKICRKISTPAMLTWKNGRERDVMGAYSYFASLTKLNSSILEGAIVK